MQQTPTAIGAEGSGGAQGLLWRPCS